MSQVYLRKIWIQPWLMDSAEGVVPRFPGPTAEIYWFSKPVKCRALFSWGNTANHWANMLAYDKIPAKLIILPSNSTALCSSIHSWRLNTLKSDGAHVTVNSSKCLHYITILQTHYYGSSCSLILQLFDSLLVEWQQKGPFQWSAPGQSSNAH